MAAYPAGNDKDYVAYLDWDEHYAGAAWAEWVAKALHGEGNVVFLGGPAGNPVSAHELACVVDTFKISEDQAAHRRQGMAGHQLGLAMIQQR